jgi:hypothetical protein
MTEIDQKSLKQKGVYEVAKEAEQAKNVEEK